MATGGTEHPAKSRTVSGKFGLVGVLLIALVMMVATIVWIAVSKTSSGETTPASGPGPVAEEPAVALLQAASPTAAAETVTAVPTATETPTARPTLAPTATGFSAVRQTEANEKGVPGAMAVILPTSSPTATPLPMPTPREIYSWTLKVPILMYHYISDPPAGADQYRLDLSTAPADFQEQMSYLVDSGYESVDLYDLSLAIVDKGELPEKPIIITLDDGYRDNYENAFPILRDLGLNATFFVATEFVDQGNPNYLDWAMIEEMAAAGMRFEPHSKTHADLTTHERDFIIWEVLGSQETIASHIGYRPRYFAYPGGRYNDDVQEIVAELDFWGAVTTANGLWHGFNDRFEWGRVRMRYTTTLDELVEMIE